MNKELEQERKKTLELIKDLLEEVAQLMEATIDVSGKDAISKLQSFQSELKDVVCTIKYL